MEPQGVRTGAEDVAAMALRAQRTAELRSV